MRLRIKDKHAAWLRAQQAQEVNFVWNYANELSAHVFERERRFIGAYELQKYTDGATKAGLGLHSHTVQEIGQEYCRRRKQFKTAGKAAVNEASSEAGGGRAPLAEGISVL
ncbi:hypothetical protein [Cupriavidus necator]|uniref:hypothetical protein n=1 Tax=Cupriavidus necator TaxID=106590 RepID=UPI000F4F0B00|nr:hypothetical protein [Cupriavidus necator]